MGKRPLLVIALIVLILIVAWLRHPAQEDSVSRTALILGTLVEITAYGDDQDFLDSAVTGAFAEMQRLEKQLSTHLPDSEISRLNTSSGPLELTGETRALISRGEEIARLSDGAFEMGLGGVKALWQIESEQPRIPTDAELHLALSGLGPGDIVIQGSLVSRRSPEVLADLGGIAKGYAADRALEVLKDAGVASATINAGGDIALLGTHSGKPWRIGIQHPRHQDQILVTLEVTDQAVVTSGDYERFFEREGVRYHHIFDPSTGHPARLCQSVTIVANDAETADALATAVFVMGPELGLALLEGLPDVEGLIVTADGQLLKSSGLPWRD